MGGGSEKTYIQLQVEQLMEDPSQYYKSIEKEFQKKIRLGGKEINKSYSKSVRDARSLFNDGYLTRMGINPSESIQHKVFDSDLLLAWCKTNINSSITRLSGIDDSYLTFQDIALKNAQDSYGNAFSYATKSITLSGVTYNFYSCVLNGVTIESVFRENIDDTANRLKLTKYPTLTIASVVEESSHIKVTFTNGVFEYINFNVLTTSVLSATYQKTVDIVNRYNASNLYSESSVDQSSTSSLNYYDTDYNYMSSWSVTYRVNIGIDASGNITASHNVLSLDIRNNYYGDNSVFNDLANSAIEAKKKKIVQLIKQEIYSSENYVKFNYVLNEKVYFGYINKEAHPELISIKNYSAYPVVQLKKNGAFYEESNKKFKSVLNKIGVNGKDFKEQLSDGKISEVFIGYGISLGAEDDVSVKYIFEFLDNLVIQQVGEGKLAYTGNTVNISFQGSSVNTDILCGKQTISGSIPGTSGKSGTYKRYKKTVTESVLETDSEGYSSGRYIDVQFIYDTVCKQVSPTHYEEITISKAKMKVESGGYSSSFEYGYTNENGYGYHKNEELSKILIPLAKDIIRDFNQKDYCFIVASSINLFIITVQVVKIKWYQTGFWHFFFIVVGAVLAFSGGGPIALAIYMIITIVVEAGLLKGTALKILMIVYAIYSFGTNVGTEMSFGNYVACANSMVQIASIAQQINSEGIIRHAQKELDSATAKNEETQKKMDELNKTLENGVYIGISDREPEMLYYLNSTDLMCNNDILFDIDSVIERMYPPE